MAFKPAVSHYIANFLPFYAYVAQCSERLPSARGPGFDSRTGPFQFSFVNEHNVLTKQALGHFRHVKIQLGSVATGHKQKK